MELVFTTVAVIGGLAFSLAVAIAVEELIFGKVLCLRPLCSDKKEEPLRSGEGQTS